MPAREVAWPPRQSQQTAAALFAVAATSTIFFLIHVGAPNDAELMASLPNGVIFALMTFYSGSVWPAIVAHCTLNLIPMALLAVT